MNEVKLPSIIHESWHKHLEPLFKSEFMHKLNTVVLPSREFYPEPQAIFRVFSMPLDSIKVVILGQDPYPQANQAIGYAFAVSHGMSKPYSLRAIEKEAGHFIDNTLIDWVEQGVFLLNTALTVQAGHPASHIEYWKPFTTQVIQIISREVNPVWLLWGAHAKSYIDIIKCANMFSTVNMLTASHPAAEYHNNGGFYGCNHFNEANEILKSSNKQIINW